VSDAGQPTMEHDALANGAAPNAASEPVAAAPGDERPELIVGAAFAGGLALALLLKRLAR
jgi:hypothetical protein